MFKPGDIIELRNHIWSIRGTACPRGSRCRVLTVYNDMVRVMLLDDGSRETGYQATFLRENHEFQLISPLRLLAEAAE